MFFLKQKCTPVHLKIISRSIQKFHILVTTDNLREESNIWFLYFSFYNLRKKPLCRIQKKIKLVSIPYGWVSDIIKKKIVWFQNLILVWSFTPVQHELNRCWIERQQRTFLSRKVTAGCNPLGLYKPSPLTDSHLYKLSDNLTRESAS